MGASESRLQDRRLAAAVEKALPDYKMVSHVGNGAFGNVWKCLRRTDPSNSTNFVAVKQINSALTKDEYLLNEIVSMRRLRAQCPNFVSLQGFRFEEANPYAYLIMEYCDGGDLDTHLKRHNWLSERSMQTVFRQIGNAMEVMLHHSVIHRDIKPQNILLCKADPTAAEVDPLNCTVKLADFGVATMVDRATSPAYGSCDYMAPEVIRCLAERQGSYDAKCDMFSVGVVLYQCLTGKLPFTRPTMIFGQTTGDLTSISSGQNYEVPRVCSTKLNDLLDKLLAADPFQRLGADRFLEHPWFSIRWSFLTESRLVRASDVSEKERADEAISAETESFVQSEDFAAGLESLARSITISSSMTAGIAAAVSLLADAAKNMNLEELLASEVEERPESDEAE